MCKRLYELVNTVLFHVREEVSMGKFCYLVVS